MLKTPSERRSPLTVAEMKALQLGPGWDDGRAGFLFCRIEASLPHHHLRAEVTWADDSEYLPNCEAMTYFDPEICLESGYLRRDAHGDNFWTTVDAKHIPLGGNDAVALVTGPAIDVTARFREEIVGLLTPKTRTNKKINNTD